MISSRLHAFKLRSYWRLKNVALASSLFCLKRNVLSNPNQTDKKFEKMVRYETDSSSTDETSSITSNDSLSWDSTTSDSDSESTHLNFETDTDGGRDYCRCHYDYRGELDEIFCPRCRKQVQDEFESEEDTFYQVDRIISRLTPRDLSREVKPRESDDSYDTWPSASEEEILNADGNMKSFRRSQTIKNDLETLTGNGPAGEKEYEGDIDDETQTTDKRKKFTKKVVKRKRFSKTKHTGRSK